jgi:ABC-2 type transport system ATP-binding protein
MYRITDASTGDEIWRERLAAIEVRHLTKRFGSLTAVSDLSFDVEPGGVTGFLGPNGAGKTTTLRLLLGLMTPTSGAATINGGAYAQLANPLREVGAVLESASFHPGRTARAHLRLQALAAGAARERADAVLDLVGLGDSAERRVGGFSLGMRQRLGLATALIGDPGVLILDEPANGLDPRGFGGCMTCCGRWPAGEGRTVLVSSHVLAEVAQSVDRVVIIDRGTLVAHAPIEELISGRGEIVRVRTPQPDELRNALVAEGADGRVVDAETIEVTGSTPEQVGVTAAKLAIPIFESHVETISLEDVFFRLTAHPDQSHPARQGRTS